ncbi:MAG: sugar ABC transporter substrate-binding protein [Spirochaetaceae bacterium]|jgi:multiple sugar transport system substrate-binding protein|nr:sugar ABC transporter substrate-binding protein [Spirochaetaceae bacterium]
MQKNKKIVSAVMCGYLLAAGLVSCAKKDGKTELNFMEVMTSPDRTAVLQNLISRYEQEHPNVKINLISPPYEQADNRLTMSLNANEPLDIIEIRDTTAPQYVTNKKVEDLTPFIAQWDEAGTLLSITKEAASSAGGKPFLVPQFFYIKALFARNDVLAKLGVTKMPASIDELYAICKQITNGSTQFGYTLRGKGNPFKNSDVLIISDIKDIDPENIYKTKDGSSVFDNPQFLTSLKAYAELFKTACPPDANNWGFNEQINAFVAGVTPFLVQDPDTVPLLDSQLGRENYTVIPLPPGKSGTVYMDYGYAGFGIPSYSKHKNEAWDFIAWISSNTQNSEFCEKYGALPVHSTAFTGNSYFSGGLYQAWADEMNNPGSFTFVKYPYASEKFPGWGQIQEQYMQSLLLGKVTAEEAAKVWADYWK